MGKLREIVLPIKDRNVLQQVEDSLYDDFDFGRRNYTIFKVGMTTLLRVSDVMRLTYDDIFNKDDTVRKDTYIKDKKTGKGNTIILKYIQDDLIKYRDWFFSYLKKHHSYQLWLDSGKWLFVSSKNPTNHFREKSYYLVMHQVGRNLGINYLGTHTMRKTGAYMVYAKTNDLSLVMRLLNHSSEASTLRYLGIDRTKIENALDNVFGQL